MLLEAITPTEPSSTFLALRFYLAQLTWLLTEKAFNVEKIDTASKENIAEANELLDTHSLVVYANHRAKKMHCSQSHLYSNICQMHTTILGLQD